ncbi:hypothetical protein BH11PSE3_BH11PSE3_21080 [soil metagenome]
MRLSPGGFVDQLFETYMLALVGLDQCPSSAPAPVKERLEANVERAERAFSDGIADGLQGRSQAITVAIDQLVGANAASRAAFHASKAIGGLLYDLEQATERAEDVLRAARL